MSCARKACEQCADERIEIGKGYASIGPIRRFFGVLFIYLPIVFFPVVIIIAAMTAFSMKLLGAKNIKGYMDFVPDQKSHRYKFADQVVMRPNGPQIHLGWKIFWQFNCNYYCPLSVALFEYQAYLVKAVENWWCPFFHEKKQDYADASIDQSYWHVKPGEKEKLHEEDLINPIWNTHSGD